MTVTETRLADFDRQIAEATALVANLGQKQRDAEAQIAKLLAKRKDDAARDAQVVADEAAEQIVVETRRIEAWKASRARVEAAAMAAESKWQRVDALLAEREAAAEMADKAIAALGKYYAALTSLDAEVNAIVPNATRVTGDNDRLYDPQAGVFYSMIEAGMPWAHREGFAAVGKTAGRLLSDRVAASSNLIRQLR